jgi:Tfp pilus assembly protein PilN
VNVNLIPEEQKSAIETQNTNFATTAISIILAVATVAIILILFMVIGVKKGRISSMENQISTLETKISSLSHIEKSIIFVEKGLAGIKAVEASQFSWQNFLPWFEKLIPNGVILKNYEYSGGKITVSGQASSVESYNKFLINLSEAKKEEGKPPVFTKVKDNGFTKASIFEIDFSLELTIAEGGLVWN